MIQTTRVPTIITCRFFLSLRQRNLPRMSRRGTERTISRLQFGTITPMTPYSASQPRSRGTVSFPPLHIQAQIENEFGEAETSAAEMEERDSSLLITTGTVREEVLEV